MNETGLESYTVDNTPCRPANTINEVIQSPEHGVVMVLVYDAVQMVLWQPNERKHK